MRKILEKLLERGYEVVFSLEAGVPVVRLYQAGTRNLASTCSLGAGRFIEDIESVLNGMLLDLERQAETA
jgi:hypothetical protein